MIALRDNYPLVRFQDGSVMNYDRAWLASAVVRAAELCRRTCLSKPRNARHQVHVQRVSGQKFKLLSIELC